MQTMAKPLNSILETAKSSQPSGQTGAVVSLDGAKTLLMKRLQSLQTTGLAGKDGQPEAKTGLPDGKPGAERTTDPKIPAMLAEQCTATLLPPSVRLWIDAMEQHQEVVKSVGGVPPKMPKITDSERQEVQRELAVLEVIMQPSHTKGAQLATEVTQFFTVFPFGTRTDPAFMQAKVDAWCTELETYPLYAVRRALSWWRRNGTKEPTLSEILEDVRLFVGDRVISRKRLLQKLLSEYGESQEHINKLEREAAAPTQAQAD